MHPRELIDRRTLERLAKGRAYERGEECFADGCVRFVDELDGKIVATVEGSSRYSVKLWVNGNELGYSCRCPQGQEEAFCKHCVAVGLAVLAGGPKPSRSRGAKPRLTLIDVRRRLLDERKDVLVDLLIERAAADETLRDRLFLLAAKSLGKNGVGMATMKEALDRAMTVDDTIWGGDDSASDGWSAAIGTLEELFQDGQVEETLELTEHAFARAEKMMGVIDDSNGELDEPLARLRALHLRACAEARPDPERLASRLFAWEMDGDHELFRGAVGDYASILGEKGLAEYRRLASALWRQIAPLAPGQRDARRDGLRLRITSVMLALASLEGGVEERVEVLRRDLSRGHHFFEIAQTYREAGLHDRALEWIENGLAAFPDRPDQRLRELAADEYHRRGRHADAVALAWAELVERPDLPSYQDLAAQARRAGSWPATRKKALDLIREEIARLARERASQRWAEPADHSALVEIHLWEKKIDAAWEEAEAGGCSRELWLELAEHRARKHPADALAIYQREIELTLRNADQRAYEAAVRLLRTLREVESRVGGRAAFERYLEALRARHKRKRNFIDLLSRVSWTEARN